MELSPRFDEAYQFAAQAHRQQMRKGTEIPYLAHLLAVTALVLEDGGDEDQAIAALLHDAAEDQGGEVMLEEIRLRFGERVSRIVDGLSDTFEIPKPPWQARKERYLAHLREAPPEVRRVSLADKLHNARSILADLERNGEAVWSRFTTGKDGTLWYYHRLVETFTGDPSPMVAELRHVVERLEQMSQRPV
jgi:(p)ppGpp synthase/HD superfamily hydrolase